MQLDMTKNISNILLLLFSSLIHAQLGINTTNPKAAIEIKSNTGGLLIPRVKTAEVINNEPGLLVFNTDTGNFSIKQEDQSWKSPKIGIEPTQFTKAIQFNGEAYLALSAAERKNNDNYINNYLRHTNKPWTISFLIRPEGSSQLGILNLRDYQNKQKSIRLWLENKNIHFWYGSDELSAKRISFETKSSKIVINKWYAITITFSGNFEDDKPFKIFIDDTNGNFSEETLNIQKGNIDFDYIDSRYLQIGRSSTNQNTIKGFNGKMAAFSIINRELKNIEEIKLLSLSPIGWMNTQHSNPNNSLIPSSGCIGSGENQTCQYDFIKFIEGTTKNSLQERLSAESNKIWLCGNGYYDGNDGPENKITFTIRNEVSPEIKTPYEMTQDLGNLKFKNFNGNGIVDISDLNINL